VGARSAGLASAAARVESINEQGREEPMKNVKKVRAEDPLLEQRGELASFIADPAEAKRTGTLPLAPPSKPRIAGDGR
jgi:hypothetical protein